MPTSSLWPEHVSAKDTIFISNNPHLDNTLSYYRNDSFSNCHYKILTHPHYCEYYTNFVIIDYLFGSFHEDSEILEY